MIHKLSVICPFPFVFSFPLLKYQHGYDAKEWNDIKRKFQTNKHREIQQLAEEDAKTAQALTVVLKKREKLPRTDVRIFKQSKIQSFCVLQFLSV